LDIRTRLIFALVAISLASMAAVGAFAYGAVQELLLDNQLRKLEAVAASKENDLERVLVAWRDRVRLVTSRTQLRILLAALESDEREDYRVRLQRILDDARESVTSLHGIELYSRSGRPVARTGELLPGEAPGPEMLAALTDVTVHRDAAHAPDGELLISFLAPMNLVDRRIGSAWVVLSAHELEDVTAETTGLGETGETLIVRSGPDGSVEPLSGRRHDAAAPASAQGSAPAPGREAIAGVEGVFTDAVDYRGERVYAATRWIADPGWGLVVKVDVAEEVGAIFALRNTLSKLALSLSAFGIVVGTVRGLVFARPVRDLAAVAERIGDGEWDLRADESAEDEIGQLGMHFNRMTEELVAANRELEARLRRNGDKRSC
jgi:HAMP domain-containing protein